ncbi:MAG: hypothetical protein V4773_03940, partial [Verrucomicrobiota bacterium]
TIAGKTTTMDDNATSDAMKRYWQAKEAGDATAKLERRDGPMPPAPTPAGQVSQVAVERIRLQEASLNRAGFALPPPMYAPGTRVIPLGDDNFRLERRSVEKLPTFLDASNRVRDDIDREERRDLTVRAKNLVMTDDGALHVGDEGLFMEPMAFQQLCQLAGFGTGARYLADNCDAMLRATNVNRQLSRRRDRELVFRTRQTGEDNRTVFATVTPRYQAVDTDQVLAEVVSELQDSRVEMVYDGTGVRATALFMPDEVVDLAAGDVFKVGIRLDTDDTGRGRVRVSAVVWRNLCLNLIVIGVGSVETFSAVHRGDRNDIFARLRKGVLAASSAVGDFLEAWIHARRVKVDVPSTVRSWIEEKRLGVLPVKDRDRAVEEILRSWGHEPGDSLADAVNAVTRSAHDSDWWRHDLRRELEEQAGRLLWPRA